MQVEMKNLWYNHADGAFEGRIDVKRGDIFFRYPCTVEAPADMSHQEVARRMHGKVLRMSDTPPEVFASL